MVAARSLLDITPTGSGEPEYDAEPPAARGATVRTAAAIAADAKMEVEGKVECGAATGAVAAFAADAERGVAAVLKSRDGC